MAETVSMPKLGFDMQEGTLVRWVRSEGETVSKGDVLAEIETDKATVEVESSASGVVRRLLVDQGAIVPIGAPIAIIGTADEKIEELGCLQACGHCSREPQHQQQRPRLQLQASVPAAHTRRHSEGVSPGSTDGTRSEGRSDAAPRLWSRWSHHSQGYRGGVAPRPPRLRGWIRHGHAAGRGDLARGHASAAEQAAAGDRPTDERVQEHGATLLRDA